MTTLLAFLFAIGVLVTFHELGHFWVARLCGVKVLRFSIGFGKPLLRYVRNGTEWVLCPIPLGGYVRMLDSREGEVPSGERHLAFDQQPVSKRIAIVAAGPIANLLLAVLLYCLVFTQGINQLQPLVGTVLPQSPAAAAGFVAGDRIEQVAGQTVENWQQARLALVNAAMPAEAFDVTVQSTNGTRHTRQIDLQAFPQSLSTAQQGNIGLSPARYLLTLAAVTPDGAAQRAGLQAGDQLKTLNGQPLANWESWVSAVHSSPGQRLNLGVLRGHTPLQLILTPDTVQQDGQTLGRVGAAPKLDEAWIKQLSYQQEYNLAQSALAGLERTASTAQMSLRFIGHMLIGQASFKNLSGPVAIAEIAGKTAKQGWLSYLEFLALISISIGILNLLPIPVLDGGHLMYYVAELVRGRPVSERAQLFGQKVGFILLALLMAFALLNDFGRLLGS